MQKIIKEILKEYELISFCGDTRLENTKYELLEIYLSDETYTDKEGVDHKNKLQKGDFEIFDIDLQNTYGFCRKL